MEPRNFQQVLAQTFVVVPAYNEGRVIHDVVAKLAAAFANIVVVNDGSSDDTAAVLKGLPVTVVRHHINLGQGAALQTGITFALERGASHIVTFDADGQHRVEDALAALRLLAAGECDVVCGSRFLGTTSNIPPMRKLILKAAVGLGNLTTGTRMTDAHNGLRALSRKAAACLDISQAGMAHASEIISQLHQHDMVIREVPVQIDYTEYSLAKGQSSLNSIDILVDLVIGRFLK
jgi:glycosyltransferase involved in cell wall biosynthesis